MGYLESMLGFGISYGHQVRALTLFQGIWTMGPSGVTGGGGFQGFRIRAHTRVAQDLRWI